MARLSPPGQTLLAATALFIAGCGGQAVEKPAASLEGGPVKWTVLVYMNAANNLAPYSDDDIQEMERVAQNAQVRIVVQWKTPNPASGLPFKGAGRFFVRADETKAFKSTLIERLPDATDMGKPATLKAFIDWAKGRYPAKRYAVIIWNHGNGWRENIREGVSYDDATGSHIATWDLASALPTTPIDILAFDSSLMQMAEVAYEVRGKAKFIAGSEESPPGEGYPYHRVLARFRDTPDAATPKLAQAFRDAMVQEPGYSLDPISQSVIDTAKMPALSAALDALAAEMVLRKSLLGPVTLKARNKAKAYSDNGTRVYRDLIGVLNVLAAEAPVTKVRTLADAARSAARAAILFNGNNVRSPGSYGLSIEFAGAANFVKAAATYQKLSFAKDTRWDDWLKVAP